MKKEELDLWKSKYTDISNEIYIRPMEEADVDKWVTWRNSDMVKNYYIYRGEFTRQSQLEWMKANADTGKACLMIICLTDNDRPVGCVQIKDIDRVHNKGEYGIFIGEADAQGKGYGNEAAKMMLRYGFEELSLHRIYLEAIEGNERAIKSYENAGFIKEGVLKDNVLIDGSYRNIVWMGAINPKENS